jgi:hypothetical protein
MARNVTYSDQQPMLIQHEGVVKITRGRFSLRATRHAAAREGQVEGTVASL